MRLWTCSRLLALLCLAAAPALAEAPDGGLLDDGGVVVSPPALVRESPALYPPALEGSGTEGEVRLRLTISEAGAVTAVEVDSPADAALTASAVEAAKGLGFRPATLGDTPVAVILGYSYFFVARSPDAGPAAPVAEIAGTVRTRGTREPLPGARLEVVDGGATAETDADGHFRLRVPAGELTVQVSATGYTATTFEETLSPNQRVEVIYRLEHAFQTPYETVVRERVDRAEVSRVQLAGPEIHEIAGTRGEPLRVIMLLPGVASLASGLSYPVVRGSVPAATGFFLDGVRIPQLYHLGLGPSVVHPALIDGIDFYPANAPSGYGNLTAGVVAAQLKAPRDKLHLEAQVESINAGAYVEVPIPQTGTDITLAGRFSYTGWFLSAVTQALTKGDLTPVADFYDYQARVEQKVGKATLRLLAFGSSDLVGAKPKDPQQLAPYLVSRFHRLDLRGQVPVGPGTFEAGATVGWEDLGIYAEKQGLRVGAFLLSRFLVSGRAQWRVELSRTVQGRLSADVERQVASIENTESLGGGNLSVQPQIMGVFSGAAAELAWNPDRFWLVAGLRAASYHAQPGVQFWALEPRLSARYALADWLIVKSGAGLFHQPPTLLLSLPISDVASLKDGLQETVHLALGFEVKLPWGLELSLEGYFNPMTRVLEKSLTEFITGGASFGDRNPARYGQAYGLEVLLRAPAKGRFFGWLSYSLSRSERLRKYPVFGASIDDVQVREGFVPFAFDQTHNLNLVAGYQLPHAWKLSGTFHFNTGRPESGEVSSRTQVPAMNADGLEAWRPVPLNQVDRLPAFFRIDARVSKAWTLNDVMLELYVDLFNATFTPETYAWTYARGDSRDGVTPGPLTKTGFSLPLFSWSLGLKGSY